MREGPRGRQATRPRTHPDEVVQGNQPPRQRPEGDLPGEDDGEQHDGADEQQHRRGEVVHMHVPPVDEPGGETPQGGRAVEERVRPARQPAGRAPEALALEDDRHGPDRREVQRQQEPERPACSDPPAYGGPASGRGPDHGALGLVVHADAADSWTLADSRACRDRGTARPESTTHLHEFAWVLRRTADGVRRNRVATRRCGRGGARRRLTATGARSRVRTHGTRRRQRQVRARRARDPLGHGGGFRVHVDLRLHDDDPRRRGLAAGGTAVRPAHLHRGHPAGPAGRAHRRQAREPPRRRCRPRSGRSSGSARASATRRCTRFRPW